MLRLQEDDYRNAEVVEIEVMSAKKRKLISDDDDDDDDELNFWNAFSVLPYLNALYNHFS